MHLLVLGLLGQPEQDRVPPELVVVDDDRTADSTSATGVARSCTLTPARWATSSSEIAEILRRSESSNVAPRIRCRVAGDAERLRSRG
jgi:hypothetical protein